MSFFRAISPRAAWTDFVEIWRGEQRYKIYFLGLAFVFTSAIFLQFYFGERFEKEPEPIKLIYINSWRADRTDAEIRAENEAMVPEIEEKRAKRALRERQSRESYQRLGERFGMEFDEKVSATPETPSEN